MPSIDIEVYEFVWSCSNYDIKELIKVLVENEHLPKDLYNEKGEVKQNLRKKSNLEIEFGEKMDLLKEKYHIISDEHEQILETIFKKYN